MPLVVDKTVLSNGEPLRASTPDTPMTIPAPQPVDDTNPNITPSSSTLPAPPNTSGGGGGANIPTTTSSEYIHPDTDGATAITPNPAAALPAPPGKEATTVTAVTDISMVDDTQGQMSDINTDFGPPTDHHGGFEDTDGDVARLPMGDGASVDLVPPTSPQKKQIALVAFLKASGLAGGTPGLESPNTPQQDNGDEGKKGKAEKEPCGGEAQSKDACCKGAC